MRKELKPCPFCGQKATIKTTYIEKCNHLGVYAGCYNKKCPVPCAAYTQTSEIDGWNYSRRKQSKIMRSMVTEAWNCRADDTC